MELNANNVTINKIRRGSEVWVMHVDVPRKNIDTDFSPELRIKHDFSGQPDDVRLYVFHNHGDEVIIMDETEFNECRCHALCEVCQRTCERADEEFSQAEMEDETKMGQMCDGCTNHAVKKTGEDFDETHMTFKQAKAFFGMDFEKLVEELVARWKALQLIVGFGITY